jgi:hypothetical protein
MNWESIHAEGERSVSDWLTLCLSLILSLKTLLIVFYDNMETQCIFNQMKNKTNTMLSEKFQISIEKSKKQRENWYPYYTYTWPLTLVLTQEHKYKVAGLN